MAGSTVLKHAHTQRIGPVAPNHTITGSFPHDPGSAPPDLVALWHRIVSGAEPHHHWCSYARSVGLKRTIRWGSDARILKANLAVGRALVGNVRFGSSVMHVLYVLIGNRLFGHMPEPEYPAVGQALFQASASL
jgi:hypothetical protein